MFKNLFGKLTGSLADIAKSAVSSSNTDLMEAMVAAGALTAYADGELSSEEMVMVKGILDSSDQLKEFGDEPVQIFDKYCDKLETSKRIGKMDLMKEIADVKNSPDEAQRVLLMAIEVADASDGIEEAEMKMLRDIAKVLNLSSELESMI
jgi:tellurite resistance protein TerB